VSFRAIRLIDRSIWKILSAPPESGDTVSRRPTVLAISSSLIICRLRAKKAYLLFSDQIRHGWDLRPKIEIAPLMNQLVPSNLKVALELEPESSEFLLYHGDAPKPVTKYKLVLNELYLNVCFVILNRIPRPHSFKIPYVEYDTIWYSSQQGSQSTASGVVQLKNYPSRVLACFIKSSAFHGEDKTNPFVLTNPKLTEFNVSIDTHEFKFEGDLSKIGLQEFYNLARDCYLPRHGERGRMPLTRLMLIMGKWCVCRGAVEPTRLKLVQF
jgi:hypothetical protein